MKRLFASIVAIALLSATVALVLGNAVDSAPADPQLRSDPYVFAAAVTPSDSTDLTNVTRAVYVGGTGDLVVIPQGNGEGGTAVTFKAVPTGTTLLIRVSRVKATSTTATNLVALW